MLDDHPQALAIQIQSIPAVLTVRPQWVTWRYEQRDRKWTKVLKNPRTGRNAKSDNAATWGTFDEAIMCLAQHDMDGIGFVFSALDEFAGIDLDKCRDPVTGTMAPWAQAIIADFESYAEVSPSKAGVKIFVRGNIPPGGNRKGQIEMYDHARYFTLTGHHLLNTPATIEARQATLDALHARIFPPDPPMPHPAISPPRMLITCDDDALLSRALAARNGSRFAQLWAGDTSSWHSHSEADLALCAMLAFWCGVDVDRIDRLFRRSGLYRDKWDERHYGGGRTYGQATIALVVSRQGLWTPYSTGHSVVQVRSDGLRMRQVASDAWRPLCTVPAQEVAACVR